MTATVLYACACGSREVEADDRGDQVEFECGQCGATDTYQTAGGAMTSVTTAVPF